MCLHLFCCCCCCCFDISVRLSLDFKDDPVDGAGVNTGGGGVAVAASPLSLPVVESRGCFTGVTLRRDDLLIHPPDTVVVLAEFISSCSSSIAHSSSSLTTSASRPAQCCFSYHIWFLARDSIYAIARSLPTPVRLAVCLSGRPSVRHTGGSVKDGSR